MTKLKSMDELNRMRIWEKVCETDPKTTKLVNQRGGFTAICAQGQLKKATELWGPYGGKWGVKCCSYKTEGGEISLEAVFYYPDGEFEIASDKVFKAGDDNRKKLLTDATTKALSKLGFNADVFEGRFDDNKYVEAMTEKFSKPKPDYEQEKRLQQDILYELNTCETEDDVIGLEDAYSDVLLGMPPFIKEAMSDAIANRKTQIKNGVSVTATYRFINVNHASDWMKQAHKEINEIKHESVRGTWVSQNEHKLEALDKALSAQKYIKDGKTPAERVRALCEKQLTAA